MESGLSQTIILFALLGLAFLVLYMMFTEMLNYLQTRVPFVPTRKVDVLDMVSRVGITEADVFIDLGSGNGKVVFMIEELTGAKSKGIQRSGWTQVYAKLRKFFTGSKSEFVSGNFFDNSWSEATVIYGYLYPFLMNQVGQKALEDCKPGTKLVIRDFPIKSMKPQAVWDTPSGHEMFLYII